MKQFVYVMKSESGLIKVGVSAYPEQRRAALQTQSGFVVDLILIEGPFNAAGRIESQAHKALSRFRGHGEWFGCEVPQAVHAVKSAVSGFVDDDDMSTEEREIFSAELCEWIALGVHKTAEDSLMVASEAVARYRALLIKHQALEQALQDALALVDQYAAEANGAIVLAESAIRKKALHLH